MNNKKNGMWRTMRCAVRKGWRGAALALLLALPAAVQAQTDYSGTYYIASGGKGENNGKRTTYNYNPANPANNFYLCPTEGWCFYKPVNDFAPHTSTDYPNPFLTTYKCRDGVYDATQAVWIIEKAPAPNSDYYYIKQKSTGKYLVSNGQISTTTNPDRIRVHLESIANLADEGDRVLFTLVVSTLNSACIEISPKGIIDGDDTFLPGSASHSSHSTHKWLTVNNGNYNYLVGRSDKANGPTGYANTAGIVGLYARADANAPFYLEDVIARPTIGFNTSNQVEITDPTGTATAIYYTTDGNDPTVDENGTVTHGTSYDGAFDPADGVTTIKAISIIGGEASNVATFTPPVLCGSSRKYLIQNQNNAWNSTDYHFYLIPGDVESGIMKLNTTSLFRPTMEWHFLNAGVGNGVQYYYIVNSNGKYLCVESGTDVQLKDYSADNDNKFKFSIESSTDGTFNIVAYGIAAGNRFLNKASGNARPNIVILHSNAADANSRWKFIRSSTLDKTAPFTESVPASGSYSYYKIENVSASGQYIVPRATYAGTSNSGSDEVKMNWYFEVAQAADASDWLTYYYIRNAITGDYLYFSDEDTKALMGSEIASGKEDHYMFTWARTATDGAYYLLPKYLKDASLNQFYALQYVNTTTLQKAQTRDAAKLAWRFESSTYHCATPTIEWSDANGGGYVITSTEVDARKWYTFDDGLTLTTTSGTAFTTPISVATLDAASVTLRAIAARNDDGSDASSVPASLTVYRVETPAMMLTDDGKVQLTCATEDVNYYYAIVNDRSDLTVPSIPYTGPIEGAAGKYIKAIAAKGGMINSQVFVSEQVVFQCAKPIVRKTSPTTFTIECSFPTSGVTIRYNKGANHATPDDPTTESGTLYGGEVTFSLDDHPFTVKAIAYADGYTPSAVTTKTITADLNLDEDGYYVIANADDFGTFSQMVNGDDYNKKYKIINDITIPNDAEQIANAFTGELKGVAKADGSLPVVSGLRHALFNSVEGGKVNGVILKDVVISQSGNVGAICNEATGDSRIYNCGILPTDANFTTTSSVGSTTTSGTDGYCGSLVGLLDGSSRVINCFSYANVTGGNIVGGIVGNNNTSGATQDNYAEKTIVVNCFFYGDIDTSHVGGTPKNAFPVYGGNVIDNSGEKAINNYNYYRDLATFDNSYKAIARYNRSWPAEERNIRRFEYYRSILNSNRRLCAFWITDHQYTDQEANGDTSLVAKWVLDRSIAPYPILKKWGKYPSIINPDTTQVWDTVNNQWVLRKNAAAYQGKRLGTLKVTVNTGAVTHQIPKSKVLYLPITDMDTLNYDYCYGKVQLPYYNEIFGDPSSSDHGTRYYGNYTDKVVTAWKVTSVTDDGRARNAFVANWETGYNYADRNCTAKDIYTSNGNRAFAQGGYYYVPEGVTEIVIEAYWGTAFYLHGKDHAVDRVNVCNNKNYGDAFAPAGTLPSTWEYNDMTIYNDFSSLVSALSTSVSNVYDQAIVLVGNFPLHAQNDIDLNSTTKKVTLMSADLDMDNEPDFCFPFQWRSNTDRLPILPIRFDFLSVPELGLTMRHNTYAYAIGIMVPRGHFEITETSFMHTTQFEYMATTTGGIGTNHQQPLILNGGQFEQIVIKGSGGGAVANTRNIIMGGHLWMKRFTPGSHAGDSHFGVARHCAVSVMGGEYPEFYLSGIYRTDITAENAYNDNPHCYTNGGRFGIMAGAGMEAVKNSVYFEIDHSIIDEFYGGGTNASNPVGGSVNVTINNSLVLDKYCGGPKVGSCQTVTTNATGTIFNQYFGGGNGGTNLYREKIYDNNVGDMPTNSWEGWSAFTPISTSGEAVTYDSDKGYHAEFEFEVFNQSNGINTEAVVRTYRHWAKFGTTETGNVTNNLTRCKVINNFYAAGNLGNVSGNVTSDLDSCILLKNAFGAGYSASIPHFPVHDKSKVSFPYRDASGVCHNGSVDYRTDEAPNDTIIQYTWCYKNSETLVVYPLGVVIPAGVSTSKPVFQYNSKWYCLTTVSLENLGSVSGAATLTLKGNTVVGTLEGEEGAETLKAGTGNVYGGGDESAVVGNTTVNLQGNAHVLGNVFGGGNNGSVGGNSSVTIQDPVPEP